VRFVEVDHGGWDTHVDNHKGVRENSPPLDNAVSALLSDLEIPRAARDDPGRARRPSSAARRRSTRTPAATTTRSPTPACWPAAAYGAGRSTARPTTAGHASAGPGQRPGLQRHDRPRDGPAAARGLAPHAAAARSASSGGHRHATRGSGSRRVEL
jgi:hypothetical protein